VNFTSHFTSGRCTDQATRTPASVTLLPSQCFHRSSHKPGLLAGCRYIYFTGWKVYNDSHPTSQPPSSPPELWVLKSTTDSPDGPYVLSNGLDIPQGMHGTTFKW